MDEQAIIEKMRSIAAELRNSQGYTNEQLMMLISDDTQVPVTIFAGKESPLRSLVTYLHRNKDMELSKVAKTVHRSYRAVWGADMKEKIAAAPTEHYVPISCFDERKSILESVVTHMRRGGMRFTQIANLLNKDPRTIWTVWNRAQKKDGTTR